MISLSTHCTGNPMDVSETKPVDHDASEYSLNHSPMVQGGSRTQECRLFCSQFTSQCEDRSTWITLCQSVCQSVSPSVSQPVHQSVSLVSRIAWVVRYPRVISRSSSKMDYVGLLLDLYFDLDMGTDWKEYDNINADLQCITMHHITILTGTWGKKNSVRCNFCGVQIYQARM